MLIAATLTLFAAIAITAVCWIARSDAVTMQDLLDTIPGHGQSSVETVEPKRRPNEQRVQELEEQQYRIFIGDYSYP